MKNVFLSLFSALLSLAMILPATAPVMAAPGQEGQSQFNGKKTLMIRAPQVAEVNQSVTITVHSKHANNPVAGAAVYALKISQMPLKTGKSDYAGIATDFLTIAKGSGIFLGNTDTNGTIIYKFADSNRYLLIASMDGYVPGFSRISINSAPRKRLNIKVPGQAEVAQPVTIKVNEMFGGGVVGGAAVYARKISVSGNITAAYSAPIIKADAADYEHSVKRAAEIKEKGFLLGATDDQGQLVYTFSEAGIYELAAIKDSYVPGFARINIHSLNRKVLQIEMEGEVSVGQAVSIVVRDKFAHDRVAKAGIYAIRMEAIITGSKGEVLRADPSEMDTPAREKFAAAVKEKGSLIGWTDANGLYLHKFSEIGHYIVIAVKDGYAPDFDRIYVKPLNLQPNKKK